MCENMKLPKVAVVAGLLLLAFVASSCSRPEQRGNLGRAVELRGWQTDFDTALSEAAKLKRPVLLNFTGSDWCTYCIEMEKDTFSQAAFKDFADKNLVLVELDFPNRKMQSDQVIQQNQYLQQRFGVEGFPTFILMSYDGKVMARHAGYLPGGPEGFIEWIQSVEKK